MKRFAILLVLLVGCGGQPNAEQINADRMLVRRIFELESRIESLEDKIESLEVRRKK
jgi:hypothetical protein